MERPEGIEPLAFGLEDRCSTIELRPQHKAPPIRNTAGLVHSNSEKWPGRSIETTTGPYTLLLPD